MDPKVTPLDLFLPKNHPVSGFLESLVRALSVLFRDVEIKVKLRGRDSCLFKPISIDWAQMCGRGEPCLLPWAVGRSVHCPTGVLHCWSCSEGPGGHRRKLELHMELKCGSPATVDTLANRLHGSTPMDNVTITMPPFFFYRDKKMDTQLGLSGLRACL